MARVVLLVSLLLAAGFAGCIASETEPHAGPVYAASPDETIRRQLDAMEPVELGGGGVIRVEGPAFLAIPVTAFQELFLDQVTWTHEGARDEALVVFMEPLLPAPEPNADEEPRHQHGGPDGVCGGSGAWHWSSLHSTHDMSFRGLEPGRHNLYVSISTGAVRLAFNHAPAERTPIDVVPMLDVSHVYSAELRTLPTATTHGARTGIAATWNETAGGAVFATGAWSVTFTGVGTDSGYLSEWQLGEDGCQSLGRGAEGAGLDTWVAGALPAAFPAGTEATWRVQAFLEGPGTISSADVRLLLIEAHADVVHAPWF